MIFIKLKLIFFYLGLNIYIILINNFSIMSNSKLYWCMHEDCVETSTQPFYSIQELEEHYRLEHIDNSEDDTDDDSSSESSDKEYINESENMKEPFTFENTNNKVSFRLFNKFFEDSKIIIQSFYKNKKYLEKALDNTILLNQTYLAKNTFLIKKGDDIYRFFDKYHIKQDKSKLTKIVGFDLPYEGIYLNNTSE